MIRLRIFAWGALGEVFFRISDRADKIRAYAIDKHNRLVRRR